MKWIGWKSITGGAARAADGMDMGQIGIVINTYYWNDEQRLDVYWTDGTFGWRLFAQTLAELSNG